MSRKKNKRFQEESTAVPQKEENAGPETSTETSVTEEAVLEPSFFKNLQTIDAALEATVGLDESPILLSQDGDEMAILQGFPIPMPLVPAADPGFLAPEVMAPSEPQKFQLHDIARRFVNGYQDRWWPSIRKHADSMGFNQSGTEDECKAILRHWGAKLL